MSLAENFYDHLPHEGKVHDPDDGNGQQGNRVGLVEKVQRNIVHRPLVDVLELIDGWRIAAAVAGLRRRILQRRRRRCPLLHPAF